MHFDPSDIPFQKLPRRPPEEEKEEKKPPKKDFKTFLKKAPPPTHDPRPRSIFELAKNERKPKKQETPKENPNSVHVEKKSLETSTIATTSVTEVELTCPGDLHDLIAQMCDYVLIEENNGISTTTVTLNLDESSIFNKTELVITHYDSAPHSFNLLLMGTEEAVTALTTHINTLEIALKQKLPAFQINLKTPELKKKERALEKRKKLLIDIPKTNF